MRRRALLGAAGCSAFSAARSQSQSAFELALTLEEGTHIRCLSPHGDGPPIALASRAGRHLLIHHREKEWLRDPLPEPARSVSSDSRHFWIAAASGIWRRPIAAGTWVKEWEGEGLEQILFVGEKGYAAGAGKTVLFTDSEGKWTPLPAAADPTTNTSATIYHWIHFLTPRIGIISGASRPPRGGETGEMPAWLDPNPGARRKEWPGASLTLETRDAGLTWRHSVTSIFGKITRVRYARDGKGLALIEFHDQFEFPSEVFAIDLKTGSSDRAFRRKDRAVTDTWLFPGAGYLAAIEPPSDPAAAPLGRVYLFHSTDLHEWRELDFPKALGARAFLSGSPSGSLWIAVDTGLLFHLPETRR
jgi:hypothetical protein